MLVFQDKSLVPIGHTDSDFQSDRESRKSTYRYVFIFGGGAISWRTVKQSSIDDSTMEVEYIAASKAAKEAVWLKNYLLNLGVVPSAQSAITLYYDNSGAVANTKEPRSHKRGKYIERKYYFFREIVHMSDVKVSHIVSGDNLADPFTKGLTQRIFDQHVEGMGVRSITSWLGV